MDRSRQISGTDSGKGRRMMTRMEIKTFVLMLVLTIFGTACLITSTACCFEPAKREAFIASLPRGESFSNDGMDYVWMPTLKAEVIEEGKTAQNRVVQDNQSTGDQQVVEQKGRFNIYAAADRASARRVGEDSSRPVALNLKTNSLAIITGNLWLKLGDMQNARAIAEEYNLVFSFSNAAMQTAFYRAAAGADMESLRRRLQADPRIMRVTLDMVDRIRHPR